MWTVHTFGQADKSERQLAFQFVGHSNNRAFRHIRVVGQHFFHRAGRQAVAGNIDHVVGPRHDIDITIFVDHAGVTGFVIAGERGQIRFAVPCLGVPQVWQGTRGQWQFDCNSAKITGGQRIAAFV